MQIAIVKNDTIETTGELNEIFSNVSFPVTGASQEWMTENNVVPVTYWKDYNNATQKLVQAEPYLEEGKVFAITVENLSDEEAAAKAAIAEKQKLQQFEYTIQAKLDEVAKEKDYDNALDTASYSNSTNETWKAESASFIAWRDSMWDYYYNAIPDIKNGNIEFKSFEENMPTVSW